MAAINVKISDMLKNQGDSILREHNLNATQYITLCWQYLAQHGRPPFKTETRVFTTTDAIATIAGQFSDALSKLKAIRIALASGNGSVFDELKLELSRLKGEILLNGWRLESEPEENGTPAATRHMLPRVNFQLTRCDYAVSGISLLPPSEDQMAKFESALKDFGNELAHLQSVLREANVLPSPEPVREFVFRGQHVTMAIVQPDDYMHGAWVVRMTTKTSSAEHLLEGIPLSFPRAEGRIFTPGSIYGGPVRNPQTLKYELGFRFYSGYSEFHMYSNGCPEEENNTSLDRLAEQLSAVIDTEMLAHNAELSDRQ